MCPVQLLEVKLVNVFDVIFSRVQFRDVKPELPVNFTSRPWISFGLGVFDSRACLIRHQQVGRALAHFGFHLG